MGNQKHAHAFQLRHRFVADEALMFDVNCSREGNEFAFRYNATPKGDELTGIIKSELQGEESEIPFTAKKR